ncbi:MAG: hypothetical protein EXS31_14355 [Pedosphaera sp.]|nr:hypothetical protein [Pedosphaera sp.]
MKTTRYDPEVIQKFADKLYASARTIVFLWTLSGMVAGLYVGESLFGRRPQPGTVANPTGPAILGTVSIGLLGFAIGRSHAFALKLRAQTLLCQKQIEENTRKAGTAAEVT